MGRQRPVIARPRHSCKANNETAVTPSGCLSLIIAQKPTQSLAAPHRPLALAVRIPWEQEKHVLCSRRDKEVRRHSALSIPMYRQHHGAIDLLSSWRHLCPATMRRQRRRTGRLW